MDWKTHQADAAPPDYRMPAEWEPHAATWIAWPHNRADWPGRFEPIPWVFVDVIHKLSAVERVSLLTPRRLGMQAPWFDKPGDCFGPNVDQHQIDTNRVWTRDYAPTFVVTPEGKRGAIKWRFNGWAKYSDWELDYEAGRRIIEALDVWYWPPSFNENPIVLEGGSIDVNGQGTLLTTEECLLSEVQQRNPGMSRADYEKVFADWLGVRKVIWLKRGIAGDDTHGHVDDLARFVNPTTVVVVQDEDRGDANYEPLRENWEVLKAATDQDGRPLKIVSLPMPSPIWFQGQRLPASYANFYIANGLVLVPTFNDERDRQALNTLAELFPDRQVVGIYCGDLVWGLGTLHCMTQQEPL